MKAGVVSLLMVAGSMSGARAQVGMAGGDGSTPAAEPEAAKPMAVRSFERFALDSGVADGLWAEGVVTLAHESVRDDTTRVKTNASAITAGPRLVYGIDIFEGGITIPYRRLEVDIENGPSTSSDGIGDISLYGKVVPLRSEWVDAGAGLQMTLPSGDQDDLLGTGKTAFLPYATMALHLGVLDLLAHGGYSFTTDKTRTARDSIVFGGGLHRSTGDRMALRGEFVGYVVDTAGENPTILTFQPGVDISFPGETVDVWIRPTGAIGMTEETPDWGVGGSVVVLWNPS